MSFLHWCCSVAKLPLTVCNPMDCSMPGSPVLHNFPEFSQTPIHWSGDATQPYHPLLSYFLPVLSLSSIRVFSSESALHIRGPKYWSFSFSISPSNENPGLISFRIDWAWSRFSLKDPQESSLAPQFKNINSSAHSLLYVPTLTSLHDYWKNHSFDCV